MVCGQIFEALLRFFFGQFHEQNSDRRRFCPDGARHLWGGLVWLLNSQGIGVRFPSPGGEDDFARRAACFLFGVCPAFLVLGTWIGYVSMRNKLRLVLMWLGALVGTAAVWMGTLLLQSQIEQLSGDDAGTRAVIVFYGFWVLLSALGAAIVYRVLPK